MDHLNRCKTSFRFSDAMGFFMVLISGLIFFMQGAQAHCGYLCQRSYSTMGEAGADHPGVPALSCQFLQWEVANPRTTMPFHLKCSIYCTVVAIWKYFRSNMYGSASSDPSSEQGRRKLTLH